MNNRCYRCVLGMLMAMVLPALVRAAVELRQARTNERDLVTLENEFWEMTFEPERGGACTRLIYKPARKSFTSASGLFSDYVQEQPMQTGDWAGKPYACTVKRGPREVSVTLVRSGVSLAFVAVSKTITLQSGSPVIRAAYTFANQTEAMGPVTISPRYHHVLSLPEACRFTLANARGCQTVERNWHPQAAGFERW